MKKLLIAAVASVIVVSFAADAFAQTRTHTCTTTRVGNVIHTNCRTIVPATAPATARQAKVNGGLGSNGGRNAVQGRCAIEAGGTYDPATGYWRYRGYEHAHMRYNACISRALAGRSP